MHCEQNLADNNKQYKKTLRLAYYIEDDRVKMENLGGELKT